MPVAVFVVGCAFGTEKYSGGTLVNMLIVSLGVAIASYGNCTSPATASWYFVTEHWTVVNLCSPATVEVNAAAGELNFIVIGVVLQMCSICTESTRLVLVQILLQRRGLKLNPITTLYYIAPCCFGFLLLPFILLEAPKIMNDPSVVIRPGVLVSNAAAAFGKCVTWVYAAPAHTCVLSRAPLT